MLVRERFEEEESRERRQGDSGPPAILFVPWHPVSSSWTVRATNWSSRPWLQMVLEVNSGHTSSQESEPCSVPSLIWMWHLQATACHTVRIISPLKCRSWSFAQEEQLKILLSGGTSHWRGLNGHLPHPAAPREVPHPPGPSLKHLIQGRVWAISQPCPKEKAPISGPVLLMGKLRFRQLALGHCAPSAKSPREQVCATWLQGGKDKPSHVPSTLQFVVSSSYVVQPSQQSYKTRTTTAPTILVWLMPGEVKSRSRVQGETRCKRQNLGERFLNLKPTHSTSGRAF